VEDFPNYRVSGIDLKLVFLCSLSIPYQCYPPSDCWHVSFTCEQQWWSPRGHVLGFEDPWGHLTDLCHLGLVIHVLGLVLTGQPSISEHYKP